MRFGIDAHHLDGKPQGSRSHLRALIPALARELAPEEELHVFSFSPETNRTSLPGEHHRIFPDSAKLRVPLVTPALELWHRLDLFHSQYVAPPWSLVPEVVTIHDVLFETHPELFEGAFGARSRALIRRSARVARRVLTVSKFSKEAIVEHYGLAEERVVVTPNAVDRKRFRPLEPDPEELLERYGLERPFLLNVGRLEPRKNIERLVAAFSRLGDGRSLAVAGVPDFRYQNLIETAARLGRGRVKLLGAVPDDDLPGLYNLAEAFVYPSLAEGFGMPVLEAMACGTPVLTSSRGGIPEVAGDAALFVNPEEEDSILDGLEQLSDADLRRELSERGLARAARFDWTESARRTLKAYRESL